ncbi:MAG: hypothetical protein K2X27_00445 [Candidatus Obscuribacterales bacterium]|nr:hypothetical protein [Candidatus Obscuribacterales bacterium]
MKLVTDEVQNTTLDIRVEHLIALVGGNPLPIAVSAELLLKPGGTLTLLHSPDSSAVAQRLIAVLKNRPFFEAVRFDPRELDESSPNIIRKRVTEVLSKNAGKSMGLDYTGGTKAMAAHAYAIFEKHCQENSQQAVSSYLDARNHSLRTELLKNGVHTPKKVYLSNSVKIFMKEMMALHGWSTQENPFQSRPLLPSSAMKLTQIFADTSEIWKTWLVGEVEGKCFKDGKKQYKSKTHLKAQTLNFTSENAQIQEVFAAITAELGLTGTQICAVQDAAGSAENFCDWLRGEWLESAVAQCLCGMTDLNFNEVCFDINTRDPQIQLDVAAVRGHQAFFVSCTTDSKKDLTKSKLLEIRFRAKQLGGDEAAYCLVCCYKDAIELEAELRKDLEDRKVHVIGIDGLVDLSGRLRQWIDKEIKG